jgi:hypothetical protein
VVGPQWTGTGVEGGGAADPERMTVPMAQEAQGVAGRGQILHMSAHPISVSLKFFDSGVCPTQDISAPSIWLSPSYLLFVSSRLDIWLSRPTHREQFVRTKIQQNKIPNGALFAPRTLPRVYIPTLRSSPLSTCGYCRLADSSLGSQVRSWLTSPASTLPPSVHMATC